MKQHKVTPPKAKKPSPTTTREELENCVKHIVAVIDKNPKKVAQVFKGWIDGSPQTQKKKRAA